jgi:eukaryotic-like serine/threonine-protein kinase
LGACLSAAAGALTLICYDLALDDALVPYAGVQFDRIPASLGIAELVAWCGRIVEYVQQYHPAFVLMFVLWAAMALAVSLGEWTGRWPVGLVVAAGGGALGYALLVSERPAALSDAMISLGLAAIIYALLRYLATRVRG